MTRTLPVPTDACWCEPFDGPMHPFCPIHGKIAPAPNPADVSCRRCAERVSYALGIHTGGYCWGCFVGMEREKSDAA